MTTTKNETSQKMEKSIFEYVDYRSYVKDYYLRSKEKNAKFSHRFFSRLAGFKSSNFIKFIIDGKSNISEKSAANLARAMKLGKNEAQFFVALVAFNQATSSEERRLHAEELIKCRGYESIFPLREALFNYTSRWYLSVLRGVVGLPDFREDPEWIRSHLLAELSQDQITKGLEDLLALGLLKRDTSGRLLQNHANIASDDEVAVSSVAHFHREMMDRASESIDRIARDRRDISGITLGVSVGAARKIKELTQQFRKEVVAIASEDPAANAVYQLNIQFFPLFEVENKKKRNE